MKWIKCLDKMPKFNQRVICFQPADDILPDWVYEGYLENGRGAMWHWREAKNCSCEEELRVMRPTHWMPLPDKPVVLKDFDTYIKKRLSKKEIDQIKKEVSDEFLG